MPQMIPVNWIGSLQRQKRQVLVALAVACLPLLVCDLFIGLSTSNQIVQSADDLKSAPTALLLGTNPFFRNTPNPFYHARIHAAVTLFNSGKVRGILVSGDNSRNDYNEPEAMKQDLVKQGIPPEFITLDYAGFRTLDSIVRAKKVFKQEKVIVISQRFHLQRALFLARQSNLQAQGFPAADPDPRWHFRVRTREILARLAACCDVWILHRSPHFLGPAERVNLKQEV